MSFKNRLRKFALIELIISVGSFIINYFFYHFVTDDGITLVWQPEAGKPFVADLIGVFATLFLFAAVTLFVASFIFDDKTTKQGENNGKL